MSILCFYQVANLPSTKKEQRHSPEQKSPWLLRGERQLGTTNCDSQFKQRRNLEEVRLVLGEPGGVPVVLIWVILMLL